jgi:hypothetical protein
MPVAISRCRSRPSFKDSTNGATTGRRPNSSFVCAPTRGPGMVQPGRSDQIPVRPEPVHQKHRSAIRRGSGALQREIRATRNSGWQDAIGESAAHTSPVDSAPSSAPRMRTAARVGTHAHSRPRGIHERPEASADRLGFVGGRRVAAAAWVRCLSFSTLPRSITSRAEPTSRSPPQPDVREIYGVWPSRLALVCVAPSATPGRSSALAVHRAGSQPKALETASEGWSSEDFFLIRHTRTE